MDRKNNPPANLIDSLEQDYTRQLQTSAAEEIAALREILGPNPLPEHQQIAIGGNSATNSPILVGAALLVVAALMVLINFAVLAITFNKMRQPGGSFPWQSVAISLGVAAFTVLLTYILVMSFRKRNTPLYVISLAGIQFRDEPKLIPWAAVEDFSVIKVKHMGINTMWIVQLHLLRDYRVNWPFSLLRPATYHRNKHRIVINFGRGTSPGGQKFVDYIGQYHAQSLARARLAELEEQV